jgi:predicted PurR-regulated permease PerM
MIDEFKKELTSFRLLAILLTIAVGIYLFQIAWQVLDSFSDVLVIILCAWLLSFILEPAALKVSHATKLSILWSAFIVYAIIAVIFTAATIIFIPTVITQLQTLAAILPDYLTYAPKAVQNWNYNFASAFDNFVAYIPSVAQSLGSVLMILILSFYLIIDKERITNEMYNLAPKKWHENLKFIQKVIDDTFASFLRIQVLFGLLAGISTWIVLTIFGVNFAASTSLIAGILNIIPLIGPLLGIIPAVLVVFVSDPANPAKALLVFVILLLIQQITFNAIGPKLMGKAFKLHPIIILLSFIIGAKIAGPLGAIFAIPVLGIIGIIFRELGHYFINPEKSDK